MKFGLIGDPISHSQSPELFRRAYNGKYDYDLIEGKYFEESYSKFLKGYKAINVTAPFKEAAYEKADVVSGPAALIGAANILVKGEDGVSCHNSDFTGIILCVAEALFPALPLNSTENSVKGRTSRYISLCVTGSKLLRRDPRP